MSPFNLLRAVGRVTAWFSEHRRARHGRQRYQGGGPVITVPQRRRRLDTDAGRYRRLSGNQKQVNAAHARQRGPGERANAQIKSWAVLRRIRSCPNRATTLVKAVQVGGRADLRPAEHAPPPGSKYEVDLETFEAMIRWG